MSPKGYYSTQEAAALLGVTRATLHNWLKQGHVKPPRKIGAFLLWTAADIARLRTAKKRIKPGRPRKAKGKGHGRRVKGKG